MELTASQPIMLMSFWKATVFVQVLMLILRAYCPHWIQMKIVFSHPEEVHFQDAKIIATGVINLIIHFLLIHALNYLILVSFPVVAGGSALLFIGSVSALSPFATASLGIFGLGKK